MRADHLESAGILRDYLSTHGGDPSTDSGVWGGFAKAIEGTASLFGNDAAILALSHWEKHGSANMTTP